MGTTTSEARPPSPIVRWVLVGGVVAVVLLADQLSKAWALDALEGGRVIEVFWTLQFNLAFNTGMAFSQGAGGGQIIGVIATLITLVLVFFASRVQSRLQLVLIGAVIGGALGNVVDRLTRVGEIGSAEGGGFMSGGVVDFIDVQWWPIFNIADACVVVGGLLLAVLVARTPEEPRAEAGTEGDDVAGAAVLGDAGDPGDDRDPDG